MSIVGTIDTYKTTTILISFSSEHFFIFKKFLQGLDNMSALNLFSLNLEPQALSAGCFH